MSDEDDDFEIERTRRRNFFDDGPTEKKAEARASSSSNTSLPVTSLSTPRSSAASAIQRESPIAAPVGRTTMTASSSYAAPSTAHSSGTSGPSREASSTDIMGRSTATVLARENASLPALSGASPLASGELPVNRPLTALAQAHASLNSQRRQSFNASHPQVTNPNEAVRLLLLGNDYEQREQRRESSPVCLEHFRSLASKKKLLSAALATHEGNVILTVLRFLKSTLDFDIFATMLQSDTDAAKQYLTYLKQCGNSAEYERLSKRLENVDPAMLEKDQVDGATKLAIEIKQRSVLDKYLAIVTMESADRRKDALYRFASSEAGNSSLLADFAKKSAILLEVQQKLDSVEAVESKSQSFVYSEFPLTAPVVGRTLGDTLRHCAIYHLSMDPNICPSCEKKEQPIHLNSACLKKAFNVSDKVFQMAMTRALTQSRRYELIDKVLAPKGIASLFSGSSKKVKPAVAPDRVIDVIMFTLKQCNRSGISLPSNIRAYLQHIDDSDTMEAVARDYQLYDIVTEVYCQKRDRQRLMQFIHSIPSNHPEHEHAKYKLKDPSIKWKN